MSKKQTMQDKQFEFATNHKVYCTNPICSGHGTVFYDNKTERKLCVNCGRWIYRDDKTRLKYEMLERGVKIDN